MLEPWQEWYDVCALAGCCAETREALDGFARSRFRTMVRRFGHMSNVEHPDALMREADDAWHRFETRLVTAETQGGKRYKDWLFGRIAASKDSPLDVVQGGATVIMRDVVRDMLRREYMRSGVRSLDAPVGCGESALTLQDLLPGTVATPADLAAWEEYESIAAARGAAVWDAASQRERVALLAMAQGLSLAHPAVVEAAGCGKSSLYSAYRKCLASIVEHIRIDYPDEDAEAVRYLVLAMVRSLLDAARAWESLENVPGGVFKAVEAEKGVT